MKKSKPRILLVDDGQINHELLKNTFKNDFYIHSAKIIKKMLDLIKKHKIQVLITDPDVASREGEELLEKVKEAFPEVRRIALIDTNDLPSVFTEESYEAL